LYDGLAHVNVGLPAAANEGGVLEVTVKVEDETLIEPFVNKASLRIAAEVVPQSGPTKERTKRPERDKDGQVEKRPAGITIPEPTEVRRTGWKDRGMDERSAMRAVLATATEGDDAAPAVGAYDLFINMDNEFLLAEKKAHAREAEMLGYRYKFGMTLAALSAIRFATDPKRTNAQDGDDDDSEGGEWTVEALVAATTDAMAPALLPMVDVLAELDEADLQAIADGDDETADDEAA
jgi:hypothetical protein